MFSNNSYSIRQAFCGLHGHDTLLHFERDRMFLKCVSCGHESPGWSINEPAPSVMAQGAVSGRENTGRRAVARHAVLDMGRLA